MTRKVISLYRDGMYDCTERIYPMVKKKYYSGMQIIVPRMSDYTVQEVHLGSGSLNIGQTIKATAVMVLISDEYDIWLEM